ncbi:MAG: SDR family oxidoreductase, partial [Steroidobacteraceae bacterium]
IGRAIVETFAEAGARVVVSSRKLDACEALVQDIKKQGGDATAIACNVSSADDCVALAEGALKTYGAVDIFVGNAGVNPKFAPLGEIPLDAYQKVVDANIRGNLVLCQRLLPQMVTRKHGVILIISSVGGFVGTPGTGVYSMTKAANMSFVRTLATEYGQYGIRVNSIAPGLIVTDMARMFLENEPFRRKVEARTPLRRVGQPQEIASIALCLASDAGSFVTGQTLAVDGGSSISSPS